MEFNKEEMTPAPRTMAEIEWDDAEHHLAEALFGDTRKVVMLARDTDEEGDWSEWVHCRMEDGSTDLIEKEYLTPTGRKYRLEPEGDSSTVAESENVAPEQGSNLKGLLDSSPRPAQQALARDIFGSFPKHVHWAKHTPEDDVAAATGGELTTQDVVDECRAVRKERAAPESAAPRPERVPEFDPAYTYRDKDGETWEYLDGKWVQGDSRMDRLVSLNVNHGLNNLLPKYGPYTRIEDTNE